ncbi:hypothetical protein SD71_17790 [Cohnella kolymensis]|uniref:Uncharacterized protein n=1 Tax=Cohnella kolymensis TaxID=1590652 RepID=A0ABR5A2F9_9BACL|nr:hypothetical protein [Cohnella kolymensis]KIL34853.1 hypothetical protein SD71_17790 [Cohnella kolymensis]
MSPVFGAMFLWTSTAILWWSGWREEAAEDIPERAVAIYLAGWPFAVRFNPHISPSLTINGAMIWTVAAVTALAFRLDSSRRWAAVSAGVLLGAVHLLLNRVADFPSGMAAYYPSWAGAVLIGGLAGVFLRNAPEQIMTISTALFIGEIVGTFARSAWEPLIWGESSQWLEGWWIAVIFARLWSVSVRILASQARKRGWKAGLRGGEQR